MLIVLHGQDSFQLHERFGVLRRAFVAKYDPNELNVINLDLASLTPETLHQHLSLQGLFSAKRFIGIRGFEKITSSLANQLQNDLTMLPADSIVVCCIPKLEDLPKELQQIIKQNAKLETFAEMNNKEVERWLRQRLAAGHVTISAAAFTELAMAVGKDLWLANNLINQLQALHSPITPAMVQQYVRSPLDENIFHFTDAIATKNTAQAIRLLHEQITVGANPFYLLTMLARQMELLLQAKASPTDLTGHPYVVQKTKQHAKRFSLEQLKQLYLELVKLDWQFKQTNYEPLVLLDRWVIKATGTATIAGATS